MTVTIGGQVRFQMKSKKRIKEAFNENERVVRVLADATDPSTLILMGQSAGPWTYAKYPRHRGSRHPPVPIDGKARGHTAPVSPILPRHRP